MLFGLSLSLPRGNAQLTRVCATVNRLIGYCAIVALVGRRSRRLEWERAIDQRDQ